MIDLKYHIASLIAIFCALAVGIFIGSNLVGNDVLLNEQRQIISSLEKEFNMIREQNRDMQSELNDMSSMVGKYRSYTEKVFPLVVEEKLEGMNIAVIDIGSVGISEKIKNALLDAGAYVPYVAVFDWEQDFDWDTYLDVGQPAEEKDIYRGASQLVGDMLIEGVNSELKDELTDSGYLKLEGELGQPVDGVVFLDGSRDDMSLIVEHFNVPLATYFYESENQVVVGECEDEENSYLELYQLKPFTTIDNIDTSIGLTSMIFSLTGKVGNYGVGENAESIVPDLND